MEHGWETKAMWRLLRLLRLLRSAPRCQKHCCETKELWMLLKSVPRSHAWKYGGDQRGPGRCAIQRLARLQPRLIHSTSAQPVQG